MGRSVCMWPAHTPSNLWCKGVFRPFYLTFKKAKVMKKYAWMNLESFKAMLNKPRIPFELKDSWLSHFDAEKRQRIVLQESLWDTFLTKDFLVRTQECKGSKGVYTELLICLPKEQRHDRIA